MSGEGAAPVRRLRDGTGWQEAGAYSRAVRSGGVIAVSGTTAHGPDGQALFPGDTYGQTRHCLGVVLQAVIALGGGPDDVVRTRVLLAPEADWQAATRAHGEVFAQAPPANSTYYVAGLIGSGFLVEVEADAVVGTAGPRGPAAGLRFSVRANNDLTVAELTALARAAEEHGFDQLWVSNDLFLRSAPALMGVLAAATTRLQLGIAVMNPYSVHVVELAMVAATLQEASGGRCALGVGAGSAEFLGWAGIDRSAPLSTVRQAVGALRVLLGHEDVDPAGLPGWMHPVRPLGVPVDVPVPVYVGGMGPRMLRMAGECADGALPLLYPPEHFATARRQVRDGAVAAGRADAAFDLPACFWVSVCADGDAGRAALANKLAYYGPSISPTLLAAAGLTPEDFLPAAELAQRGEDAAALVDDRMLTLGIAGTAADVVRRCRELRAMGADHLSFGPPLGPDPVQAVRTLGTDVLPALRTPGVDA